MDWIERLFHISPDEGSGMIEIALPFAVAIGAVGLIVIRKLRKRVRAQP